VTQEIDEDYISLCEQQWKNGIQNRVKDNMSRMLPCVLGKRYSGYGRIFRSKKTIKKESPENVHEGKHRLIETRFAQVGAMLLSLGFATRIWGVAVEGKIGPS